MVKFHSDIQHLELRNKYSVDFTLSTPEDIAKWRTERRARYPTLENVEKKSVEKSISEADSKKTACFNQSNNNDNYSGRNRQNANWRNSNNSRGRYNNKRKYNSNNFHQNFNDHQYNVKRSRTEDVSAKNDKSEEVPQNVVIKPVSNIKIETTANNSLNLLSYYESDDETEVSQAPDEQKSTENVDNTVQDVISELLSQVEKNVLINKNHQTTSKRQKKKAKKLPPPSELPLNFSRLSLFQKVSVLNFLAFS